MSKAAEIRRARFSPDVLEHMQKLWRMISAETYGKDGPPIDLTWAEIEDLGHEIGKLTGSEFDQTVQRQQAERFDAQRAGPQCGKLASSRPTQVCVGQALTPLSLSKHLPARVFRRS